MSPRTRQARHEAAIEGTRRTLKGQPAETIDTRRSDEHHEVRDATAAAQESSCLVEPTPAELALEKRLQRSFITRLRRTHLGGQSCGHKRRRLIRSQIPRYIPDDRAMGAMSVTSPTKERLRSQAGGQAGGEWPQAAAQAEAGAAAFGQPPLGPVEQRGANSPVLVRGRYCDRVDPTRVRR